MELPRELQQLKEQIDACERDAGAIIEDLDEELVNTTPPPAAAAGAWSIAQCLDHLAKTNAFYLRGMIEAIEARRARHAEAFNGLRPTAVGRWFAGSMEPPVKFKVRTPMPLPAPHHRIAELLPAFRASHRVFRDLLDAAAHVDVNRVIVRNPFHKIVRMRLSTVLLIIPAHDRRHLWQARNVRRALGR
jgi:hypothetical protein